MLTTRVQRVNSIGPVKQNYLAYYCDYFLIHRLKHVFWVLKEPSHRDISFEYPQHMFWLGNKKNNFQLRTLILGPEQDGNWGEV